MLKFSTQQPRWVSEFIPESSTTPVGIDLGSRYFKVISKPNVLLASGAGTNAYRVGEIYLLDTRVQMPVTRGARKAG